MKISQVYLKVANMETERDYWISLLQLEPVRSSPQWTEFEVGATRLGLLLDEESVSVSQSAAAFSIEVPDEEADDYVERGQTRGGSIILQGLENRILMRSPSGHEFEISIQPPSANAA